MHWLPNACDGGAQPPSPWLRQRPNFFFKTLQMAQNQACTEELPSSF